ncbi:hypothetical protein LTR12_006525 [Friedmanniomyces endolithicus]|nr:hypothetical protein LTR74_004186 [Friedmanniomyces endolithicus]KAK1819079.1 hypothetical protein LTR12_006525 [Friedmanniomyces endolithicus]
MPDCPYDWLPSYPSPAYAGNAGTPGPRPPISPMSAANSVTSLPRPGWAPSAPTSAYGSISSAPSREAAHTYRLPSAPYQHRRVQTPTRSARYSASISSRGSFGVALLGEVIERSEIVELPAQDSGQSLSVKALRDLDQQHRSRRLAPIREPYNLAYGDLPLGHEPPVEPKVLIMPTHRPAHSTSSGTTLVDYHLDAVELPGSPPPVHRRSIPLMEAVNYRLSSYSSYKHEGFDEYDLPVELEGDGSTGVYELPTPHPYSVQAASTTAGTDVSAVKTRHTWDFGGRSAPDRVLDRWSIGKGKWHFGGSISEDRRKWIIIGVVSLLIVTIIVAATVGGALG